MENTECVLFDGYVMPNGYGSLVHEGKTALAHRVAYCQHHGIPLEAIKGVVIRHRCDVRLCINPEHLEPGTHKENTQDMFERGRWRPASRGDNAKLTEEIVSKIRSEYRQRTPGSDMCALADKYGVVPSTIHKIIHRKTWK